MKRFRNHFLALVGLIVLLAAAAGCQPAQTQTQANTPAPTTSVTVLKISGSGSTQSVLSAVEAAFEAAVPGYNIEILSGSGTGSGVKGVIDKQLDAAAMARPFNDEEM